MRDFVVLITQILPDDTFKFPQFGDVGQIYGTKNKLIFGPEPLRSELKKMGVSSGSITTDQVRAGGATIGELIKTIQRDEVATALEKEVKRQRPLF